MLAQILAQIIRASFFSSKRALQTPATYLESRLTFHARPTT